MEYVGLKNRIRWLKNIKYVGLKHRIRWIKT
jgi:hypothetical protein